MQGSNPAQERSWCEWIEIPTTDFERAKSFYETVFGMEIQPIDYGVFKMGIFPYKNLGVALCYGEHYKPSADGPVVYLNANPDLQTALDRVVAAGGQVLRPKKMISPDHGYMALFLDSEGNRLALRSNS